MRSRVRHVIKYIFNESYDSYHVMVPIYDTKWLYVQSQWKLNMSVPYRTGCRFLADYSGVNQKYVNNQKINL